MNSKQLGIVAIVAIIILVGGVIGLRTFGGSKTDNSEITPTPSQTYKDVDDSVQATLTSNPKKTEVLLQIKGLAGKYDKLEYELSYQTDNNGVQGASSDSRNPVALSNNQGEFERSFELGSCSTGGKCSYDKGVRNFHLVMKFYTSSGEIHILKKDFESI